MKNFIELIGISAFSSGAILFFIYSIVMCIAGHENTDFFLVVKEIRAIVVMIAFMALGIGTTQLAKNINQKSKKPEKEYNGK